MAAVSNSGGRGDWYRFFVAREEVARPGALLAGAAFGAAAGEDGLQGLFPALEDAAGGEGGRVLEGEVCVEAPVVRRGVRVEEAGVGGVRAGHSEGLHAAGDGEPGGNGGGRGITMAEVVEERRRGGGEEDRGGGSGIDGEDGRSLADVTRLPQPDDADLLAPNPQSYLLLCGLLLQTMLQVQGRVFMRAPRTGDA